MNDDDLSDMSMRDMSIDGIHLSQTSIVKISTQQMNSDALT